MEGSLTSRVARGISWTGAAQAADYAVTLASLSLLAHLLSAADFGAQAAASVVVGVALMVGDLGLGSALIQTPVLRREDVRKAALLCILSGGVLGGLVLTLSPWIGGTFQDGAGVSGMLRVLWLCALLHPAGAVPRALMTRGMDFRRLALIDAGAAVASGATAVALALKGAGALSLAWGYAVRVGVTSGLAWGLTAKGAKGLTAKGAKDAEKGAEENERWEVEGGRQKAEEELQIANCKLQTANWGLLRFGLNAMGASVLNYLSANVDYLLIGWYLGPAPLGLYYLAYQLVSLAHFKVVAVLLKVLHPALAAVQGDLERLRRGYLRAVQGIALFVFPVLAMLWALAGQVVTAFYGVEKGGAIRLVEILCAMGVAKSVGGAVGPVLLARGRADISLLWNLFALATAAVAVATGLLFGVEGAAAAVSLNAILLLAVSEGIVHRLLPLDFRAYLGALTPVFLCAACAGGATRYGMALVSAHLLPVVALIWGGAFGAAVYGALIYAFRRSAAYEAMGFVRAWRG